MGAIGGRVPVVGQQFVDVLGRLGGQTPEYIGQILRRLDAIELAGLDQAVDDGGPFSALVAASE